MDSNIVQKLINSFKKNSREQWAILFFIHTGCTPTELINLKKSDLDFKKKKITLKSNKKIRIIKLPQELDSKIKNFLDGTKTFIFSSRINTQLTKRTIHRILEKGSAKIGEKITTHDIRKYHIQKELLNKSSKEVKKNLKIKRLDIKKFISPDEFIQIKNQITNRRDKLIFDILFETGCRLKELILLKVKNFNLQKAELIIDEKSALNRTLRRIPLAREINNQIKKFIDEQQLNPEENLFSTRQSNTITEERVFQIIKQHSLNSGFKKINSQVIRYSHISNSFHEGKSVTKIKSQTGIRNLDKFHLYGNLFVNPK